MRKYKVLFVANDASKFGANQSLVNMIRSFRFVNDYSINFHVVIPLRGPVEDLLNDESIPYSIVSYRFDSGFLDGSIKALLIYVIKRVRQTWFYFFCLKELARIVKSDHFDIIHTNSSVNSIGIKLAQKCKVKHVWHFREMQDIGLNLRPYSGWSRWYKLAGESDAVICISHTIANHYNKVRNPFVIYDAVSDQKSLLYENDKEDYFLFCGSIIPSKGVETAIDAFSLFNKVRKGYKLIIAGEVNVMPSYYEDLRRRISHLELIREVEFLGFRKDVSHLMFKAQALLMCSFNEGLGRVTAEAMLNNCLVIGRNSGATQELICDGKTGFLFQNTEELTESMLKVTEQRELSREIRESALKYAKGNFLEETYGDQIVLVYRSLLQ